MHIIRAPLRISYIGGGTDYLDYFQDGEGLAIGTTINQYVYVFANELSEIAPESIRFTYRKTESVQNISEVEHPVLKNMWKLLGYQKRLNLGTMSDIPAGSGLGGSSAFAVALSKALHLMNGVEAEPQGCAKEAIQVERVMLQESGGVQDQYHSAIGGFRAYQFRIDGVAHSRQLINRETSNYLDERQMLLWLGDTRISSLEAMRTQAHIKNSKGVLDDTLMLAKNLEKFLETTHSSGSIFEQLCATVSQGWELKKKFSNSSPIVLDLEKKLKGNGALAIKLLGAGNTGFLLVMCEPDDRTRLHKLLPEYKWLYPKIEPNGVTTLI